MKTVSLPFEGTFFPRVSGIVPPTLRTEEFVLLEHSCANWIKVSVSVNMKTHFWHDFYYTIKVSCFLWQISFGKSHPLFFVRCFFLYY